MTVTYQVGGGGHLDIDFWVCLYKTGVNEMPLVNIIFTRSPRS